MGKFFMTVLAIALLSAGSLIAADSGESESNWEKFKVGAKQAGSAAWEGTKNTAEKTGDAIAEGAKKTGEFFSDKYHDAKEYIHEKTAPDPEEEIIVEPQPFVEPQRLPRLSLQQRRSARCRDRTRAMCCNTHQHAETFEQTASARSTMNTRT